MKRFALSAITVVAMMLGACSSESYTTDTSVLPKAALDVVTANYGNVKVSQIKIDKDALGGDEYEVILANGTQIEFDAKGVLDNVKAGNNDTIPGGVLPPSVATYLRENYAGQQVVKYDLDNNCQEVKLTSGLEVKFDLRGKFMRVDR